MTTRTAPAGRPRRISIEIAKLDDPIHHALDMIEGGALFLAESMGSEKAAEHLYQLADAWSLHVRPKWSGRTT